MTRVLDVAIIHDASHLAQYSHGVIVEANVSAGSKEMTA